MSVFSLRCIGEDDDEDREKQRVLVPNSNL